VIGRQSFVPGATARKAAWALVIGGVAAAALGVAGSPERTWPGLLLNGFYMTALALGGMVFIAVQCLSGAAWSANLRRIPEALMAALPVAAMLMLILFFGRDWLYPATRSDARTDEWARALYLGTPFFFGRMVLFLAAWTLFARRLRRSSLRQDEDPSPQHHRRLVRDSAAFVVVFAISFSLASFDWLMTLTPRWGSTIFAVYTFAGVLVGGIAAVTLALVLLADRGYLADVVTADHLHDLGKLLFAFSTFWAYIWFSQYLLIWYGNLPEETTYYAARTSPPWMPVFLLNLVVNWVVPFVILLPRAAKRSAAILKWVAIIVLAGRWLDLYLVVMPATLDAPSVRALDMLIVAGHAGALFLVVTGALASAPLVPVNAIGPRKPHSRAHEEMTRRA
jgi:hypothetical protein